MQTLSVEVKEDMEKLADEILEEVIYLRKSGDNQRADMLELFGVADRAFTASNVKALLQELRDKDQQISNLRRLLNAIND